MKKLLTLFVFLMCVLGAEAKWSEQPVYTIDYSTYQGFPFYVLGYVPEWNDGIMTDYGAYYRYVRVDEAEETSDVIVTTHSGVEYYRWTEGGGWHQYFIADGIPTTIDHKYKIVAKVRASAPVTINVNMGWGWGSGEQLAGSASIPGDTEFQEVEWIYEGIGGGSCNLVAQPGSCTETIEWLELKVYEWIKEGGREPVWLEDIENGDAETPWTAEQEAIAYDDMDNNYTICAWARAKGVNMRDDGRQENWCPYVAPIVVDPLDEKNHVFLCDGQPATTEGDASSWDNQFWIQSKHAWKSGLTLKIKFRYMCDYPGSLTANTLFHKQTPMDYLVWHSIGDVTFTKEWKTFDKSMVISDDMAGGWSIAFNLNSSVKDAVKFYFDDLSWQYLQLDEGYFLSGVNTNVTKDYDNLDNAIEFEDVDGTLEATIGTFGDASTYVDQLMISTTRGDDAAFKGATLLPNGKIHNDPDEWLDYAPSANKKLDVPGLGVWKVYLDTEYQAMAFELLEGTLYEESDPVDVVTNPTEITVHGQEREYTYNEREELGLEPVDYPGQVWDNQFFIKANRPLKAGELTKIVFQYKSSVDYVKTTTQCHGETPGAYMHWAAIGDVYFNTEWSYLEYDFTVPTEADGMQTLCFNMAEIKEACDYQIKDVQWYLYDYSLDWGQTYENLIDAEGTKNFYVKEGAGTNPHVFDPSGEIVNPTVWTIAGSSEIFGSYWDPSDTRNDMTQIEEGFYVLEKKNVSLKEGGLYEFKVVANHSWDLNYGADGERNGYNVQFTVGESGTYNLYFYFYENWNNQLAYNLEFVKGEDQMLMGDVDSNGEVNVTDAVLIIDEILDRNPWNFNAEAADVNYDSYINVTDVVLVIEHVLGRVNLNRAAAAEAEVGTVSLSSDMKTVSLNNPSAYTAFQMDVTLPMGVGLEDVLLTERAARSHSVVISEMENGSYRIIGVSMKNAAFKGNVGDLLQLQLTGNAQGSVAIDNVLFVTPEGVQHELAGVNAFGDVTGISDATRLNDNGQMINDNVFDLQGRRLSQPSTLKKGLYILNGKKQIVK